MGVAAFYTNRRGCLGFHVGSCWAYVGLRWPQVGSKMAQDRSMLAQVGPKIPKISGGGPQPARGPTISS